jgi:hypothetical protein
MMDRNTATNGGHGAKRGGLRRAKRGAVLAVAAVLAALAPAHADDAPGSAIHGFGSFQLSNDYITPRGLLVTDEGVTGQALGGLVFVLPAGFSLVAGVWNDVDSGRQHDLPNTKSWTEEDFFAGVNYMVTKRLKLSATYDVWTFPSGSPSTEQNLEFVAAYDDGDKSRAWSIKPHAEVFWAVSSPSSVVVLGRAASRGTTAYLELGAEPTYAFKSIPVTLSMPSWISVGPSEFWCEQGSGAAQAAASIKGRGCGSNNFGVLSTGLTAKTPASFIPARYGSWYLYGGFQYYNLLNGALVDAQALTIASQKGRRNVVNGFAGIGFGF